MIHTQTTHKHAFFYSSEGAFYISSLLLPLLTIAPTLTPAPAPACTSSASIELQLLEFALLEGDVRAVPGRDPDPDLDDPEWLPAFFSAETIRFIKEILLVVSAVGALTAEFTAGCGCDTGVCARLTGCGCSGSSEAQLDRESCESYEAEAKAFKVNCAVVAVGDMCATKALIECISATAAPPSAPCISGEGGSNTGVSRTALSLVTELADDVAGDTDWAREVAAEEAEDAAGGEAERSVACTSSSSIRPSGTKRSRQKAPSIMVLLTIGASSRMARILKEVKGAQVSI